MDVRLPLELIEDAQQQRWHTSLAYFVRLRSFKNHYHNFTLRSIANLLKCSPETARKHIAILKERGLLRFQHKLLLLTGTAKMQSKCKKKKLIQVNAKFKKE